MKLRIYPHILDFKVSAKTSRDVLTQRNVWYVKVWEESNPSHFGLGEIAPIFGLSVEEEFEFMDQLALIDEFAPEDVISQGTLSAFPSILFGIEMAMLDFKSGGKRQLFQSTFTEGQPIPINGLVWMGDADYMRRQVAQKIDEGYDCIKLKVGGIDFEQEKAILSSIRKEHQDLEIRLDANGAFTSDNSKQKLAELSEFNIHSIEQPVRPGQWDHMAELCSTSPIPIALDEELIGVSEERQGALLDALHPQYIILKPTLLGGFEKSDHWIELAEKRNIRWWATSALESNIGLNAIAQWVASKGNDLPQGLGTGNLFTNNITSPLSVEHGTLSLKGDEWNLNMFMP